MSEISELFKSTSLDSFPAEPSASSSNDSLLLDSFSISPNLIFLSHLSQDRPFSREAFPSLPSRPGPPSGYTYNREADRHSLRFPSGHRLHRRFVESYQLEDELGSGGYGFVMTARHRSSGREVAVKFIIKSKVPDHAWMEDELLGPLPVEVVLLQRLSHPNIIKSLDLFEDGLYFYLVQELHGSPWSSSEDSTGSMASTPCLSPSASERSLDSVEPTTPPPTGLSSLDNPRIKGVDDSQSFEGRPYHYSKPKVTRRASYDLFECIEQSEDRRLSESQSRYVFGQIVDAVDYLNELGIAHRDIKDENLVIDRNLTVKLIDFGSACAVDPEKPRPHYEKFFGTAAYASSEILLKKKYLAAPAEVWTLGVLLSYLLTGASPFQSAREAARGKVILYVPHGTTLSKNAVDLIRRCLNPNPESRITIQQIREHPWLLPPVV
ncbi:hypothetical protein AGABI2DRAFT_204544 [Agaricus bisporus var. bisporus H97]|uniref:hypothetical protein n=1 Tax=Agaricus bisporus var. bisporus (strain H97 / ATCC MYA-4626 / FGSC 10389) TaxID=936046 RepID=UPI00029F5E42|nr:hypothetical protein AGABI2DRAFT_204544 [Agaricus bisporus var. bisporus H97]EKV47429.1 hypothetical protein AGABI2DRAFT_204544 [Agaricus bisporus var. bisporus H97]